MGTTANSTTFLQIYDYQSAIPVPGEGSTADYGFRVRVSPEILTLTINGTANAAPDSELIQPTGVFARTSGGVKRFGVSTRAVIIKRLVGTDPLQFFIKRTVPWLQNNLIATLELESPILISYQEQTDWIFVGTRPERVGEG